MRKIQIDRDWLRSEYLENRRSTDSIAQEIGIASQTVQKWLRRYGIQARKRGPQRGERHPGWRGGTTVDKGGYVLEYAPDHPNANTSGYVRQHRLVAERTLGRLLERHEVVHHVDGNPANNDPSNLVVFGSNGVHLKLELTGKCPNWSSDGYRRILRSRRKDIDIELASRLYLDGTPSADIARRFGVSASLVLKRLRANGVAIRHHVKRPKYNWPANDVLAKMYQEMQVKQIAEIVGCSVGGVIARLHRIGVPLQYRSGMPKQDGSSKPA